jgi:adenylate cyclase class IV
MVGRTRVHLDRVQGLGDFLELEVMLSDSEPIEAGMVEAYDLMTRLGISTSQLIEGAYLDLFPVQADTEGGKR